MVYTPEIPIIILGKQQEFFSDIVMVLDIKDQNRRLWLIKAKNFTLEGII